MIPVDKLVEHDPANGKYGDCMRASIASILELPATEVPHFYENGESDMYDKKLEHFLKSKNLMIIYTSNEGVTFGNEEIYHLIFGKNYDDVPHACVALNGILVHDPNPSRNGLKEIDSFGFIVEYMKTIPNNLNQCAIYEKCFKRISHEY